MEEELLKRRQKIAVMAGCLPDFTPVHPGSDLNQDAIYFAIGERRTVVHGLTHVLGFTSLAARLISVATSSGREM